MSSSCRYYYYYCYYSSYLLHQFVFAVLFFLVQFARIACVNRRIAENHVIYLRTVRYRRTRRTVVNIFRSLAVRHPRHRLRELTTIKVEQTFAYNQRPSLCRLHCPNTRTAVVFNDFCTTVLVCNGRRRGRVEERVRKLFFVSFRPTTTTPPAVVIRDILPMGFDGSLPPLVMCLLSTLKQNAQTAGELMVQSR